MAESAAVTRAAAVIRGVVQGVGFRPFVARLAKDYAVSGFVRNDGGQVTVEAEGSRCVLEAFFRAIKEHAPREAKIEMLDICWGLPLAKGEQPGFCIMESSVRDGMNMPAPDIAVCDDCLKELHTPGDPRYLNPFISCTLCGPRFSIMERLPYDRENTSMNDFPICRLCGEQYRDPADRRCHAQTICCNDCGPELKYRSRKGTLAGQAALEQAITDLKSNKLIAVKGIGGFHLACSPFDREAVLRLRAVKGRESKPFAVMFTSVEEIRSHCAVNDAEENLLRSRERPIVLLKRGVSDISDSVYGTSPNIGAFLPYTPLQVLILERTGPLVMTSANQTTLPIIKDDDEMTALFERSGEIAGVLSHNRMIVRRLDDSVADVIDDKPRLLRRARGYVPLAIEADDGMKDTPPVLACGPQMKNTLCLSAEDCFFPSTEIGDLDSAETLAVYRQTEKDMEHMLGIKPQITACDLHPGYESTAFAKETGLPVIPVQHHYAHIASVMAEENLTGKVIGVSFDGTGYGTDKTVWGGEFLVASPTGFTRAGCLKPVKLLGSDESVRQGWKTAECMLLQAGVILPESDSLSMIKTALQNNVNTVLSSSMGRLFDAVSAVLGICEYSDYEGRCAIELENAAQAYAAGHLDPPEPFDYVLKTESGIIKADFLPALRQIYERHSAGDEPGLLAWRFHLTVSGLIVEMCKRIRREQKLSDVALSGGVFANRLLLTNVLPALQKEGFQVYLNHQVPPGDGGISLGQAYVGRFLSEQIAMEE